MFNSYISISYFFLNSSLDLILIPKSNIFSIYFLSSIFDLKIPDKLKSQKK